MKENYQTKTAFYRRLHFETRAQSLTYEKNK